MLKKRIEGLEKTDNGERTAFFTIHLGKAKGSAFWRDDLSWENLSKPEFETLIAELQEDGVRVRVLDICIADKERPGESISAWELERKDFIEGGKYYRINHHAKETT